MDDGKHKNSDDIELTGNGVSQPDDSSASPSGKAYEEGTSVTLSPVSSSKRKKATRKPAAKKVAEEASVVPSDEDKIADDSDESVMDKDSEKTLEQGDAAVVSGEGSSEADAPDESVVSDEAVDAAEEPEVVAEEASQGQDTGNDDDNDVDELEGEGDDDESHSDYTPANRFDASAVHHLSGMYQNWFLDYASYVILERAVPHLDDGLKPVQRRILHSMKRMDDGRFNKVANIVGHTMQFHPHGDASIGDALVQLGQKDLLVDTQGNWGNIFTGDRAAAPRYIEARLSKFALEAVFNPKTTEWQYSYDGRNQEPISLPVKFPLLLAQGAEGIAVGLSSKILPHNFNELCDASISYLRGEEFHIYPDFPTGGLVDVTKYNDGQRGGQVKVRARIEKLDSKTLVIRDVPYTKTSPSLIESITKAIEKGKVKAKKVVDCTAAKVEIQVMLTPGVSSDKTIDALYTFTDCEINISPNCCVIDNNKPQFLTVSDVIRRSTENTKALLRRELEIRRDELLEQLHFWSLEKLFIEERIYKGKPFEEAKTKDEACDYIDLRLRPFYPDMVREVTRDDIMRLFEIKMERIIRYNKDKAEEAMLKVKEELKKIEKELKQMTKVTIKWYEHIKEKYGKDHPRLTDIRRFDTIQASKVVEANQKLYIDRNDGFIGTGLKKAEFVCNCSEFDDIIIFYRDGKARVVRAAEKVFVGKNILHLQVFKKNDQRTIYNMVYRDGKAGYYYIKRFNILSASYNHEYDLTAGTPESRVMYFTANPNGEAEVIKITLEPHPKLKTLFMERDFSDVSVKGKSARGVILSKKTIHRIGLKSHGRSTLGGRKVWFDPDVNRINYDDHGRLLGEFNEDDRILVILDNGEFYLTDIDVNNHYEHNILFIEKFNPEKVWTAAVIDGAFQKNAFLKRFTLDAKKSHQSIIPDDKGSQLLLLTDTPFARLLVVFGGRDSKHQPLELDAEQYCIVRSFKAHGKRISTLTVVRVDELEPTRFPEPEKEENEEEVIDAPDSGADVSPADADPVEASTPEAPSTTSSPETVPEKKEEEEEENLDPDKGKSEEQVRNEIIGQLSLFGDDEF